MKPNAIIRKFRDCTVGVLGDFMLDELIRGEATRISPEAPVPVVRITHLPAEGSLFAGGAGNVAANIAALGARSVPFGVVGRDESGARLREILEWKSIRAATLVQEAGRITPRKIRIVAQQHQLLRLDYENPMPITLDGTRALLRHFARWAGKLSALIVSDYQKGTVTGDLYDSILEKARRKQLPIFVDPKPENPTICRDATLVTPNLREAELMAGIPLRDPRELQSGGLRLMEKLGSRNLLITRGAEGMTLFEANGEVHDMPSIRRPVYDVTGAGDTVIAVLALAHSAGASLRQAAQMANAAGSCVVLKFGTSEITPQELIRAVGGRERPG